MIRKLASKLLLEQLQSPLTKETEKIILSGGKFYNYNSCDKSHVIKKEKKEFKETIRKKDIRVNGMKFSSDIF